MIWKQIRTIKIRQLLLRKKQPHQEEQSVGLLKRIFKVLFDAEERQGEEVALRDLTKEEKVSWYGRVGQWFQLLCLTHIPVFGFFYMLVIAFRKNTPPQKKSFAMAYVLYRLLVLLLAITILFIFYRVGLSFLDELLKYAGM